jgi:hypothetical protein
MYIEVEKMRKRLSLLLLGALAACLFGCNRAGEQTDEEKKAGPPPGPHGGVSQPAGAVPGQKGPG